MRYIIIFGGWLTAYYFIYFGFVNVRDWGGEEPLTLLPFFAFVIIGVMVLYIVGILNPNLRFRDYKELLKKVDEKGYSKLNNILWVTFASLGGIYHITTRKISPTKCLNTLINKLDKNIIPSSELIKDSGFSSKHPLWKKYLELKSNKAQAAKTLAEKRKKEAEEAKKRKAEEKKKREEKKKNRLLAFKKKHGTDATKALAGKIWVNMSFELYREAQVLRPRGRKFGKKFENVVNGEERHTYRFDPYENRQGKISYNYEITTKDGLISGWKNLETN